MNRFVAVAIFWVAVWPAFITGCSGYHSAEVPTLSEIPASRPEIEQGDRRGPFVRFKVPTADSGPSGIAAGADGNMWFVETFGNKIARITMSGVITEFPLPTAGAQPYEIKPGPDGNLWFAESLYPPQIGRITTTGQITEFPVGYAFGCSESLTAGPDGAIWFGNACKNGIGRITTDGVVSPLYPVTGTVRELTAGPDGNVWFTEPDRDLVGKITPSGAVTEYRLPKGVGGPFGIITGPDGNLWFSDGATGNIDRITPAGIVKQFSGDGSPGAAFIAPSPPDYFPNNKILFVSDLDENSIERFSIRTKSVLGEVQVAPPKKASNQWIALGPDHNIWFTFFWKNEVGVYVLHVMTASPTSLALTVGQTESVSISEKRYSGSWTAASSNVGVATVTAGSSSMFNVTGVGIGTCNVTISDSLGNSLPVTVTVQ